MNVDSKQSRGAIRRAAPYTVPLTVYYDASCPLCATEMETLQELDWRGQLQLVDCSVKNFRDPLASYDGVSQAEMMTRLHARDPEGRWFKGLDAFEAVYGAAGLKGAARFWGNRHLRLVLDRIYPWVARHRQALSRLGLQHPLRILFRLAERTHRTRTVRT